MAGLFSSATLEQIRAASDIVDVIGSYLPLKRAGANFVALCPFHKEKTPSFNVNPHRQIFHCFGCHKGGDVFGFVKEFENIDFPEAVRRLADRAKIPWSMRRTPASSSRGIRRSGCCKSMSRSPSAGKTRWPTRRAVRPPAITSRVVAFPTKRSSSSAWALRRTCGTTP